MTLYIKFYVDLCPIQVDIRVNGKDVDLEMRLGDSGVAYFVQKSGSGEDANEGQCAAGSTAELDEAVSAHTETDFMVTNSDHFSCCVFNS